MIDDKYLEIKSCQLRRLKVNFLLKLFPIKAKIMKSQT